MLNNIEAVIFDLDGTLIDSIWVWSKINIDYLKKRNLELPEDLKENIEHLSFIDKAKYFKKRFNLNDTIEEIIEEWTSMAMYEYTHNVKLKPGVKRFIESLHSSSIKIALATSNSRTLLELVLKTNGIFQYFNIISTTDEAKRGKNFPDIYLLTAKKLGVEPKNCAVFEDLLPAIISAKAAGMKVFGVQEEHSDYQRQNILDVADHFIYEYTELTRDV
ncbi:HAD family hydrolase [Clostridium aciditolerans]|uniref:HAD family phosphatase n=1 Tax=Clostridium aciditolerans TaxID=339861 RepID=A0A934M1Q9_9CLOT|nr:HAD family phosphatase [Clostridium aciditolerans]MBI6871125.1 HAD family phosphatase [Clostridium aciditolerans]